MPKSLKVQAGLLAASRAAGQILNALVSFVAARMLVQEEFGTFRQMYLLLTTLMLVTDAGLVESLYYFLPRHPSRAAGIVRRSFLIVAGAQVLVGAALVVFAGDVGRSFENPALSQIMPMFAWFLAFTVCTRLWEVQLVAEQRIVAAGLVTGGFETLKALLLFAVLGWRPGVREIAWALVIATGIKFAAFLISLAGDLRRRESGPAAPIAEWMSYSMALWVPGAVNIFANQAHQFIVGFSFTPEDFALYSVACFQLPMLGVLTTSVIEVMLVRITAARSEGRHEEVVRVWHAATAQSMMFFIPLVAALAALAQPLLSFLFTPRYAAAAPLFAILTLSLPLTAIYTNNVLRAFGAMRAYGAYYFLRLALSLGLGWAGVAWYGMWGAAISTVLALYVVTLLQLKTVSRLLEVPFGRILPYASIARMIAAAALAAAPAMGVARLISIPLLALAAGGILFALVYLGASLALGVLRLEDVKHAWAQCRDWIRRFFFRTNPELAGSDPASLN